MHQHVKAFAGNPARRKPGREEKQRRRPADDEPQLRRRGPIEQRERRQVEPVVGDRGHRAREIRRLEALRRLHQCQGDERCGRHQEDRQRRQRPRLRHALHMHPEQKQRCERYADVQEEQQREQALAEMLGVEEVAHQSAPEHRQPVEPLGDRLRDELREPVPRQQVAADAGDVHQPEQHGAGDPRKPAEAAVAVERKMACEVQQHREHHRVGGVAVQAAGDAARPWLLAAKALDRRMRGRGVVEDVHEGAARKRDPEKPHADRAEVVEGVRALAEREIENRFDAQERRAACALRRREHQRFGVRRRWRRRKTAVTERTSSPAASSEKSA